jgi:hypothetical protein
MGDHDQTVLHDEDAHGNIHDDGRTLRPVRGDEYSVVGFGAMPLFRPPSDSRHVLLYRGKKLIPETLDVHPGPFSVTQWESLYSSVFTLGGSDFSRASFAPIVDDSSRVVGHVGWADGNDILVPEDTVRNDRLFWSNLQKVRLAEWRQQILDVFDRGRGTIPNFPFPPPATSPPPPKDGKRWRGPENCVYRPQPSYRPTILEEARSGPLKEGEIDQYLHDLDTFVKGGGDAFVGRHFLKPGFASYLDLHPSGLSVGGVGEPRKPYSSAYEFLVLVSPDGHLQGVMDIRKNLKTQVEFDTETFLKVIDLSMTILMVIDIFPIAVVLFRLGAKIATEATIQAIKLVAGREAKASLELAMRETKAALDLAKVEAGAASKIIGERGGREGLNAGQGLFQKQRAIALEQAAAKKEAEALATEGKIANAGSPERVQRLRAQAQSLRGEAAKLRGEAAEYASGAKSATADLPTPEEIEKELDKIALGEGKPQKAFRVPLSAAERTPEAIARLQRSLQSTARGRVVFRVEGGGSMPRLSVDAAGNVTTGGGTLNLNFGSLERALEFLAKRGPGARIIAFEVDEAWVQSVRSAAMPEHMTGPLGRDIRLVDVSYADDQMQIPEKLLHEMEKFIVPGSGKVVVVK